MATPHSAGAASRAAAAQALFMVLEQGRSLSQALPTVTSSLSGRDRALCQTLCYGVLRFLPQLNFVISRLLAKPLKKDLAILHSLLLVGTYQLIFLRTSDHAAISATVEAAVLLQRSRQKGLVNGVLRNVQRQREQLEAALASHDELQHNHPRWLADKIRDHFGSAQAAAIFSANNQQAPMWLRINEQRTDRAEYLALLAETDIGYHAESPLSSAIQLIHPVDVQRLPGFADGMVSVQDLAAQHAAWLLDARAGERILDSCSAPGGKTAHILERQPDCQLVAVDSDAKRLERVHDNLQRLHLYAEVINGDAMHPDAWWNGEPFDRILLDAPCSATGVIRRHPDIKWLRRSQDIPVLAQLQSDILDTMWSLLKPGGTLLYATCSILPAENSEQIAAFLTRHDDALQVSVAPSGTPDWQWLPGEQGGDGFYYAKLEKRT
ncbi:16S rRNA (cytosine(967)-C(5))-methyltransferase RsmB [Pseudidiomarina sp.]|uniref:16S rRNA (cytosine(967)-C(5))-methyltransferase RsmB n=1 Tax=Pseudidiomarina sp. TaxID=2081707 RepID=UPI00299D47E1|nr:16S rRNA (cytosine(967)-C(5))-methyltransferase RsmB [Pseudidiomarina sp.]MDX1706465.1 16S rRNA (cytosine(967)-C(5))-methyltransferase RsmB [Pseudidiomarina sp.]